MNVVVRRRNIIIAILILLTSGLSCMALPASLNPFASASNPPSGWKLSKDASGTCQVYTLSGWQIGKDFFLEVENAETAPFAQATAVIPPLGDSLWGSSDSKSLPDGTQFQLRTSLVNGNKVCSVWRIKSGTDFSQAETSEMAQVGKTLQEVK